MRILAIETSCDETAAAIVEDGRIVRSTVIATSRLAFERAGGVIPEQAAREQIRCILPAIRQAMDGIVASPAELDAIAVTKGPGLLGSLIVGTSTARCLAAAWGKHLIGVHHTLGHLSSTWLLPEGLLAAQNFAQLTQPQFPCLTLSASGGHTELWLRTSHTRGQLLGRTRDDAAGEAFDKGASLLGLPYPGGPAIAAAAEEGRANEVEFPRPLLHDPGLDFSFSGLKTSLKYAKRDHPDLAVADLAASYQEALCRHLTDRVGKALTRYDVKEVHLVGGVSANRRLRVLLTEVCDSTLLRFPSAFSYCTDNAAMIGAAAEFSVRERPELLEQPFEVEASLPLEGAVIG